MQAFCTESPLDFLNVPDPIYKRVAAARARQTPKPTIHAAAALLIDPETGKSIKGSWYAYLERGEYPFKPWMLEILSERWNAPELLDRSMVIEPLPQDGLLPDYGELSAGGFLMDAPEPSFATVPAYLVKKDHAVARVAHDSMYPTLYPGDRVLIHVTASPPVGSIVVARSDEGDMIVKRLKYDDNQQLTLKGDNPNHPITDPQRCQLIGEVVSIIQRDLR